MSVSGNVACVDMGASEMKVQVFRGVAPVTIKREPPTNADDPYDSFRRLATVLRQIRQECEFDAVVVGFAGPLKKDGTVGMAGNLKKWEGRKPATMLQDALQWPDMPVEVGNDGPMHAAAEIGFGVLKGAEQSGLLIALGTGLAVCLFIYKDGKYHLFSGEGGHMVITSARQPKGPPCGCGRFCVESQASGRALERLGEPRELTNDQVAQTLAPPLGELIANYVKFLPQQLGHGIVVISGGIAHKRQVSLMPAIVQQARERIGSYAPVPRIILSKFADSGLVGCSAHYTLAQQGLV